MNLGNPKMSSNRVLTSSEDSRWPANSSAELETVLGRLGRLCIACAILYQVTSFDRILDPASSNTWFLRSPPLTMILKKVQHLDNA